MVQVFVLVWFDDRTDAISSCIFAPMQCPSEVFILLIIIRSFIYYLLHSIFVSRCVFNVNVRITVIMYW